jgi:triosephosphate isomerase
MATDNQPKPMAAGNWKMNGLKASLTELDKLQGLLAKASGLKCDVLICPPATLLFSAVAMAGGGSVAIGGQDCHARPAGAHTGDISADMLKDAGCAYVIVGHSERRQNHGEENADVNAKASAAIASGLTPIICVGETEGQRDRGETLSLVHMQVSHSIPDDANADNIIIAYEPVWAIGTGRTPTTAEVAEVHAEIRKILVKRFGETGNKVRVLYGGSVKPSNARELMATANVNGALVGGASLKADDFMQIITAF